MEYGKCRILVENVSSYERPHQVVVSGYLCPFGGLEVVNQRVQEFSGMIWLQIYIQVIVGLRLARLRAPVGVLLSSSVEGSFIQQRLEIWVIRSLKVAWHGGNIGKLVAPPSLRNDRKLQQKITLPDLPQKSPGINTLAYQAEHGHRILLRAGLKGIEQLFKSS